MVLTPLNHLIVELLVRTESWWLLSRLTADEDEQFGRVGALDRCIADPGFYNEHLTRVVSKVKWILRLITYMRDLLWVHARTFSFLPNNTRRDSDCVARLGGSSSVDNSCIVFEAMNVVLGSCRYD